MHELETYGHRCARDIVVNWIERMKDDIIRWRWPTLKDIDIGRITTCSHIWRNGEPSNVYPYVDICVYNKNDDSPVLAIDIMSMEDVTVERVKQVTHYNIKYVVFPVFWVLSLQCYPSYFDRDFCDLQNCTQEELNERINQYAPIPYQYVGWC